MGSEPQLGTGQGLSHHQVARATRVEELKKWAAAPDAGGKVASLEDLVHGPVRVGTDDDFNAAAVDAWRSFRVKLDQCVHYAECR